MPRARSIAIQSDVTPARPALPCTAPAWVIADACKASASVRVDLPASGWLMTANTRRLPASANTFEPGPFESGTLDEEASGRCAEPYVGARGGAPVSAIVTYMRILGPWTVS